VIEREIKLAFASVDEARTALVKAGAEAFAPRRLQDDLLYDTARKMLFEQRSALRLRREGDCALITFKGPVQAGITKAREEIETEVGSHEAAALLLSRLGFAPWFRYQKYREEFRSGDVIAAIDETPAGVFVEIEGPEDAIVALAARLGRTQADFVLDSYRGIWEKARGANPGDMLF
jgi:adenylate cyclase, class 2